MARDDFSASIKELLAKRAAYICSNPACGAATPGPHTQTTRSLNLGVASHITAASQRGPRFDSSLTSGERASIDNGIWLCQTCAKLVDSDLLQYSVARLRHWKVEAEARALRALSGVTDPEYFPQPPFALHTPIPKIAGLEYPTARVLLVRSGWQPSLPPLDERL